MGPATLPTPLETTATNISNPGTTTFTSILPNEGASTAPNLTRYRQCPSEL